MAKVLDQSEIDALLRVRSMIDEEAPLLLDDNLSTQLEAFEAGGEAQVTAYNFKRPRLFSQDQTRVLHYIHESFARDLSVYLSAQLRTMVEITLSAVDQVLYSEYVASSVSPSALYIGKAEGFGHQIIFEIDPRLVVYTVEKLFGGQGLFKEEPHKVSQIEQRIMSRVVRRAFDELESAWEQASEIKFHETAFEFNADFVQILPSMEPVLVGTFDIQVQGHRSFVNICYPYLLLEKLLGHTGMERWLSSTVTSVTPEVRTRYEHTLRSMSVELRAELGRARLSLKDLSDLQQGDVIPLRHRVDEPIQVFIDQQEKFKATTGRAGNQRALRILDISGLSSSSDSLPL